MVENRFVVNLQFIELVSSNLERRLVVSSIYDLSLPPPHRRKHTKTTHPSTRERRNTIRTNFVDFPQRWSNGLRAAGTARSRGFDKPLSASSFSHFRQRRNVASRLTRLLNDGLLALHLQFLNRTDTEFLPTTV